MIPYQYYLSSSLSQQLFVYEEVREEPQFFSLLLEKLKLAFGSFLSSQDSKAGDKSKSHAETSSHTNAVHVHS